MKVFNFYFNNIYRPLMRSKMMDIKKIKQQRHVTQVLTVHDDMQE